MLPINPSAVNTLRFFTKARALRNQYKKWILYTWTQMDMPQPSVKTLESLGLFLTVYPFQVRTGLGEKTKNREGSRRSGLYGVSIATEC